MKEILHQRMFESGSYRTHPEHVALYEALEASMERANRAEFLAEKDKSCKRRCNDQDPPPPLPDSDISKKKIHDSDASGSKQPPVPQSSVWKTFDTREAPSSSSKQKFVPHSKQPIKDVPIPDDMNISDSEDTDTAHLPKIKTRPDWLKPVPKEDRLASPKPDWCFLSSSVLKRIWQEEAEQSRTVKAPTFKWLTMFTYNSISLQFQMEKCHLLLTDQVDLVNPECHRVVPNVSKPLPLGGPPGQIKSEREYDISAAYGISHWWFKRKEFYITRHSAPSDRSTVKSYMRIPSVVSLKTYERYMHTFLKEIVLCRADYKEDKISEADFKNLHPNDFKDLFLLYLQGQLNHLSSADKVHLFNAVNLILNKLDHIVKDFKLFKFNPGMETRIWSEVARRRSKEFIEVIKRRLKIMRIFRSLESFIGGRLIDVDYRLIQRTE
ncbi:hypothetical protein Tco_1402594 [Tanacetum coccineum]